MTPAQLESARIMIPGGFERNVPPHRQSRGVEVLHPEAAPGPTPLQAPNAMTASPRPTTVASGRTNVLGDLALAVGLLFALILVPVLAIRGIAVAAGLLLGALRGNG